MKRYIEQLISDMKGAKPIPAPSFYDCKDAQEFATLMDASHNYPNKNSKELFGVSAEELPPASQLTDAQQLEIYTHLEESLNKQSIWLAFRPGIPLSLRYDMLREALFEDIYLMPGFNTNFDFCDGNCSVCPQANYCDVHQDNIP